MESFHELLQEKKSFDLTWNIFFFNCCSFFELNFFTVHDVNLHFLRFSQLYQKKKCMHGFQFFSTFNDTTDMSFIRCVFLCISKFICAFDLFVRKMMQIDQKSTISVEKVQNMPVCKTFNQFIAVNCG